MAFWRSSSQPSDSPAGHLRPPVALALQGGGAYGAFAWGVLDRLLDEPDFVPGAISGASAGAINGVITAWGYLQGGRDGARRALRQLWDTVGQLSLLSPSDLPGFDVQLEFLTRLVSPYQFNPLNINPLREALSDMVDFGRLCAEGVIPLFISATDVSTGQQRIFREDEITIDVLMASSCLPSLCQAVEIDGHSYWDGGFTSNPPMLPMVRAARCS